MSLDSLDSKTSCQHATLTSLCRSHRRFYHIFSTMKTTPKINQPLSLLHCGTWNGQSAVIFHCQRTVIGEQSRITTCSTNTAELSYQTLDEWMDEDNTAPKHINECPSLAPVYVACNKSPHLAPIHGVWSINTVVDGRKQCVRGLGLRVGLANDYLLCVYWGICFDKRPIGFAT